MRNDAGARIAQDKTKNGPGNGVGGTLPNSLVPAVVGNVKD